MKNLNVAFRSLFKKGNNNLIKILSLSVGMAVSLTLISKVTFDQTYDNFYPDADRIYKLSCNFRMNDREMVGNYVSGGVAPGMAAEIPAIEAGTRFTKLVNDEKRIQNGTIVYTSDKRKISCDIILADSCFFDVLPRPMITGDAKDVLSRPHYALISKTLAGKIGPSENVINTTLTFDEYPGKKITIGGVYEDLPENSSFHYDMIISMKSLSSFMWDGSERWMGNDRYTGLIKLKPGSHPEQVMSVTNEELLYTHLDKSEIEKMGISLQYMATPLTKVHSNQEEVRQMSLMLVVLAFALLGTAMMNYILIVISSLIKRSKNIAIQKCYGASKKQIHAMLFSEAVTHVGISLVLATILIFAFRGIVRDLMNVSVSSLLSPESLIVCFIVIAGILMTTGSIPAYIYSRIPVASAFRNYKESKRKWKYGLLFLQFTAATFLVSLILVISKQYHYMINENPGYSFENVAYFKTDGISTEQRKVVLDELKRLPGIVGTGTTSSPLTILGGGNMIREEGSDMEIMHFIDLEQVDPEYIDLLQIPIIEGETFTEISSDRDMLVSESFARRLSELMDIQEGVVGKQVLCYGYGKEAMTIKGVYSDIRVADGTKERTYPTAMFYTENPQSTILIKFQELSGQNMTSAYEAIKKQLPDKDIVLLPYKAEVISLYNDSRRFRTAVMIGGIVTLIISLIGLIGYTHDETIRRSKEIAIRKVNGATARNIIRLLTRDISWLAIPACFAGMVFSVFISEKWLMQFSEKITLSPVIFGLSMILTLTIILECVIIKSWKIANENPVKSLKNE